MDFNNDLNSLFNFNIEKLNSLKDILTCPICYNILENPVMEPTNQHTFCYDCILRCDTKKCPICKAHIPELKKPTVIIKLLETIERKCNYNAEGCPFEGDYTAYKSHLKECTYVKRDNEEITKKLKLVRSQMLEVTDKEINPHLEEQHEFVYKHVLFNWEWLLWDKRDWKWWWWATNPWFQGKPCLECNRLWHKYEKQIDELEKQRQILLNSMITC
jgi:hypothetical protein